MTPTDALAAAAKLAPVLAARAAEVEAGRGVPVDLLEQLRASGLFRMWLPAELGGDELDPAVFVQVIETLAAGDASSAWTVMIGASSAVVAAALPEQGARQVFSHPDVIVGGALAPKGRAERIEGGWRVSGQWPFASGGRHCDWLVGGAIAVEDGRPLRSDAGGPLIVSAIFPATDVELLDTWDVGGLCGTASHDMVVRDVVVPDHLTFDTGRTDSWAAAPLYRIPVYGLLGMALSGVPLGIGRAALDAFVELATRKRPTAAPGQRLAEQPLVQDKVARVEAGLAAARGFLLESVSRLLDDAGDGGPSLRSRTVVRSAISHAVDASVAAVDAAYTLAGGSSIYRSSPLQRQLRDIHTATQHVLLSPPMWLAAGKVLLGADDQAGLF